MAHRPHSKSPDQARVARAHTHVQEGKDVVNVTAAGAHASVQQFRWGRASRTIRQRSQQHRQTRRQASKRGKRQQPLPNFPQLRAILIARMLAIHAIHVATT